MTRKISMLTLVLVAAGLCSGCVARAHAAYPADYYYEGDYYYYYRAHPHHHYYRAYPQHQHYYYYGDRGHRDRLRAERHEGYRRHHRR